WRRRKRLFGRERGEHYFAACVSVNRSFAKHIGFISSYALINTNAGCAINNDVTVSALQQVISLLAVQALKPRPQGPKALPSMLQLRFFGSSYGHKSSPRSTFL